MDDGKPLVAILLPSLKFGGAEKVALTLAGALADQGARVELLLMSREGEFLPQAERDFTVVDLACGRTWQLPFRLAKYQITRRPAAILSSFWKLNLCACFARAVRPATRLLLWEHSQPSKSANSPSWLYGISASILYRISNRVICVCNGVRDDIISITRGLDRWLRVIPNPIPWPFAGRIDEPPSRNGNRVIWVGRLDSAKNPMLALDAFASISSDRRPQLIFLGDGPLASDLRAASRKRGLDGNVLFAGFQKNPQDWMLGADMLLLTSDREGMGNVLVEAMQCGLGIVATDCNPSIRRMLGHGSRGRVVPIGDAVGLAQAILLELSNPRPFLLQQQAARIYDPEVIAPRFLLELLGADGIARIGRS